MLNPSPEEIGLSRENSGGRARLQHNRPRDIQPDVRLPTHPALHKPRCHSIVLVVTVRWVHGFGIFVPR
jgi:hypothetical protein